MTPCTQQTSSRRLYVCSAVSSTCRCVEPAAAGALAVVAGMEAGTGSGGGAAGKGSGSVSMGQALGGGGFEGA